MSDIPEENVNSNGLGSIDIRRVRNYLRQLNIPNLNETIEDVTYIAVLTSALYHIQSKMIHIINILHELSGGMEQEMEFLKMSQESIDGIMKVLLKYNNKVSFTEDDTEKHSIYLVLSSIEPLLQCLGVAENNLDSDDQIYSRPDKDMLKYELQQLDDSSKEVKKLLQDLHGKLISDTGESNPVVLQDLADMFLDVLKNLGFSVSNEDESFFDPSISKKPQDLHDNAVSANTREGEPRFMFRHLYTDAQESIFKGSNQNNTSKDNLNDSTKTKIHPEAVGGTTSSPANYLRSTSELDANKDTKSNDSSSGSTTINENNTSSNGNDTIQHAEAITSLQRTPSPEATAHIKDTLNINTPQESLPNYGNRPDTDGQHPVPSVHVDENQQSSQNSPDNNSYRRTEFRTSNSLNVEGQKESEKRINTKDAPSESYLSRNSSLQHEKTAPLNSSSTRRKRRLRLDENIYQPYQAPKFQPVTLSFPSYPLLEFPYTHYRIPQRRHKFINPNVLYSKIKSPCCRKIINLYKNEVELVDQYTREINKFVTQCYDDYTEINRTFTMYVNAQNENIRIKSENKKLKDEFQSATSNCNDLKEKNARFLADLESSVNELELVKQDQKKQAEINLKLRADVSDLIGQKNGLMYVNKELARDKTEALSINIKLNVEVEKQKSQISDLLMKLDTANKQKEELERFNVEVNDNYKTSCLENTELANRVGQLEEENKRRVEEFKRLHETTNINRTPYTSRIPPSNSFQTAADNHNQILLNEKDSLIQKLSMESSERLQQLSDSRNECLQATNSVKMKEEKIRSFEIEIAELKKVISKLTEASATNYSIIEDKKSNIRDLEEKIKELQLTIEKLNLDLSDKSEKLADALNVLKSSSQEKEKYVISITEKNKDLQSSSDNIYHLNSLLNEAKELIHSKDMQQQKISSQYEHDWNSWKELDSNYNSTISTLQAELQMSKSELAKSLEAKERLIEELSSVKTQLGNESTQVQNLKAIMDKLRESLSEQAERLKQSLELQADLRKDHERQISEYKQLVQNANAKFENQVIDSGKQSDLLNQQISDHSNEINALNTILRERDDDLKELTRLLDDSDKRIRDLRKEIETITKEKTNLKEKNSELASLEPDIRRLKEDTDRLNSEERLLRASLERIREERLNMSQLSGFLCASIKKLINMFLSVGFDEHIHQCLQELLDIFSETDSLLEEDFAVSEFSFKDEDSRIRTQFDRINELLTEYAKENTDDEANQNELDTNRSQNLFDRVDDLISQISSLKPI